MSVEALNSVVEPLEGRRPSVSDRPHSPVGREHEGVIPVTVMGPRPERVYSHSILLELKNHPLAKVWPPYLDPAFKNSRGVWDPDRWHLDRKRGETPVFDGPEIGGRRGARQDRDTDRIAAEVEDLQQLVLSPQRRSFLGGCAGGDDGVVSLRPEQPGKRVGSGRLMPRGPGEREEGFRRREGGAEEVNRRGEEVNRRGEEGGRRGEEGGRRGGREENGRFGVFRGREQRDEEGGGGWGDERRREGGGVDERRREGGGVEERRREGGGFYQNDDRRGVRQVDRRQEENRTKEDNRRQDNRGQQNNRRHNEPEWMNEYITKSDVIELRGFEERKGQQQQPKPEKSIALNNLLPGLVKSEGPPEMPIQAGISVEELEKENNNHPRELTKNSNPQEVLNNIANDVKSRSEEKTFNYDQIIESMNLNSLLGGAPGLPDPQAHVKPAAQSRFSQFFNRGGQQIQQQEKASRRSSIQDELLGNNILKEINGAEDGGPIIKIPSPQTDERYFAPISPAAQTRTMTNPLLDMINKGHGGHTNARGQQGRGVHELEEDLRRSLGLQNQQQISQAQDLFKSMMGGQQGSVRNGKENMEHQPADNLSAFKKLVAMVGNQGEAPREQAVPFGPGIVRPSPISATLPHNAPTEQEILEHMLSQGGQAMPPPPPHRPKQHQLPPALANYLAHHPVNTELLARPEAEQLMLGLNTGNITMENIHQQLANPALQQRQRDLLLSVLKVKTMGPGRLGGLPPPLPPRISPVPPLPEALLLPGQAPSSRVSPLIFPPAPPTSHLSVSPVPPTARVPSPQEMTVLTQQIMQQALIKRKLEEQKENYRRRQGDDLTISQVANNGSPLAFTPTSVMRKTAAERKDSDPRLQGLNNQVPEVKVTPGKEGVNIKDLQAPPSPGRAITKTMEEKERPVSLELSGGGVAPGGRRLSPSQVLPPNMFQSGGNLPPHHPAHPGHLLYLQNNNNMGPVSHSMLSQASAMAQQQLLLAHGLDPRLVQSGRLPPPGHLLPGGQPPVSPTHRHPAPLGQQGALARFFSPEVLAQAQSGAVPAMPPLPLQKALTLEEIERQAAAVRI